MDTMRRLDTTRIDTTKIDITKHVESAWVLPLRQYAPVFLVLLIGLLLAVSVILPMQGAAPEYLTWWHWMGVVLIYLALGALAYSLYLTISAMDRAQQHTSADNLALYLANEYLNTVLRNIGDAVISVDVDGTITLINDAAAQLTGWSRDHALGRPVDKVFSLIDEKTRKRTASGLDQVLATGKSAAFDSENTRLVARDGVEKPVSHNAAPLLDSEGWIVGAVIVFRDMTSFRNAQKQQLMLIEKLKETNDQITSEISRREQARRAALSLMQDAQQSQAALREINERLRESNAALEEYARVASHDLQEPMRKIESFVQILLEDYQSQMDEKARHYLDVMVNAARRMRRLIKDVLALSRAGASDAPFEEIDLNQVLATVKDNLSQRMIEKNADVVCDKLPVIGGERTQMVQLFQNLVGNGIKFNDSKKPRVQVYTEEKDSHWTVYVKDNGIGMNPTETPLLFAPFKRLHPQGKYEGTGIGLAVCRKIINRHGGAIGVDSKPGKGSCFWLTFPKGNPISLQTNQDNNVSSAVKKGVVHEPDHGRRNSNIAY